MKERLQDIIKFLKRKPARLGVLLFSIVLLIIGSFFFNFFLILLIAIALNLLWVIPYIQKEKHKKLNQPRTPIIEAKDETILESSDNMKKTSRPNKNKSNKKKKGKIVLLVLLSMFIFFVVAAIIFFAYIALSAGKFDPDKLYTKEASTLYDNQGKEFAQLGSEMRQKIKYDEMSEELINAVVATEDSRFFQHNGFDLPRFLKASVGQALGQNAGGASTLTMQVSKNQFTSTTSSGFAGIKRKFTQCDTCNGSF